MIDGGGGGNDLEAQAQGKSISQVEEVIEKLHKYGQTNL